MFMELTVLSLRGSALPQLQSVRIGPEGGTIGRAPGNTLVLDDPDRTVSRTQARVVCREGRFFISDQGSNPLMVNGQALGQAGEIQLGDGDTLSVGSFELGVALPAAGVTDVTQTPSVALHQLDDDPFADLLAGLTPVRAVSPPSVSSDPSDPLLFMNPMEEGAPHGGGRGAELLGDAGHSLSASDDFSDLVTPAASPAGGIDALFAADMGLTGDPLALSPLADPLLQPNTANALDPLASLGGSARPMPAHRGDHLPAGQSGYTPPLAWVPATPVPASPASAMSPEMPASLSDDWDAAGSLDNTPVVELRADETHPTAKPVVIKTPSEAAKPAAAADTAEHAEVLLAALLRGLGDMHQAPSRLSPELMERIGALLRSATEGTLHLLRARQDLKREVRAGVTMIEAQANNPLKFSPSVDVALTHLLGNGMRGFMPGETAMTDAYDDLRAHQFGVMVGMRAAIGSTISRFSPETLEQTITARSTLDAMFASNRKARLWDRFTALYADIASEAEDDSDSLFGKAFVQAYEEQMVRLRAPRA